MDECAGKVCQESAEVDQAFRKLEKEIVRTGNLFARFRTCLSHDVESGDEKMTADHAPNVAETLHYLAGKLTDHNDRMQGLLERLESQIGEVKII